MKTVNNKSMRDLVREHLVNEGTISNVEAQALYRCRALPKRINELRTEGMNIMSRWKKDHTEQRYVRYELI